MSLYVYLLWDNCNTTRVCGLTDDGVSSHFLAYHCRIAAQEHWKWGHVWACVTLVDFVHVTAVDCPILALLACRVHLVKLSVLPASKAGRSQQLLDRVVQGAVEEHHALSAIGRHRDRHVDTDSPGPLPQGSGPATTPPPPASGFLPTYDIVCQTYDIV